MAATVSDGSFENFMKILKENVVNIREMCNKYKQNASGIEEFVARSLDKLQRLDDILHADTCLRDAEQADEDGEKKEKNESENETDEIKGQGQEDKGDKKEDEDADQTVMSESKCQLEKTESQCPQEDGAQADVPNHVLPKDVSVDSILQLYAQVLLDVTFCEENILVDGIFPEKNSKSRVHKLLGMLRQPEVICQHCFPERSPKEILGEEVLECVLWRRGALLYMYCHTVQEESTRLDRERTHFIENCKQGALFLKHMLQVRTPLADDRVQVVTNSEDVFALLKKGLFSDTHVLSLIYTGELCYWHIKHQSDPQEDPEFDPRELGSSVLHLFLEMVEGPLKDHGWSSQRATQLLEFIEKKHNQS